MARVMDILEISENQMEYRTESGRLFLRSYDTIAALIDTDGNVYAINEIPSFDAQNETAIKSNIANWLASHNKASPVCVTPNQLIDYMAYA